MFVVFLDFVAIDCSLPEKKKNEWFYINLLDWKRNNATLSYRAVINK